MGRVAMGAALLGSMVAVNNVGAAVVVPYFVMGIDTWSSPSTVNTAYSLGRLNDGYDGETTEYGAQVTLGGSGLALRGISISYFSDFTLLGGITYKIYENTGPLVGGLPSPASVPDYTGNFDNVGLVSGTITTATQTFAYAGGVNTVTPTFTMTLEFAGLDATHHAGWLTTEANPPTVGTHLSPSYWYTADGGTTWHLSSLIPVPEPNYAVVVGGTLALVGAFRVYRKNRA